MPTLPDLPGEVLLRIISYVHSTSGLAALAMQCRCLHGLCDMTTRKQYYRIRLQGKADLQEGTELLLTILRHPIRGTYVRHLKFDQDVPYVTSYPESHYAEYEGPVAEDDVARVCAAVRRAGFSGREGRLVVNSILHYAQAFRACRRSGSKM